MVSFSCEACGDILAKKKLDSHRGQCAYASYTCLDCMVTFERNDYRSHTSCISEAQKYQGALFRPGKDKKGKPNNSINSQQDNKPQQTVAEISPTSNSAQIATLEKETQMASNTTSVQLPPHINVFDFLVYDPSQPSMLEHASKETRQIIENHMHTSEVLRDIKNSLSQNVQPNVLKKPQVTKQRLDGGKENREFNDDRKETKRKRLHVETLNIKSPDADAVMIDAPALVPHSNLTGGLKQLMNHSESLTYSPNDSRITSENSPLLRSPLKKSKHEDCQPESFTLGTTIKAMIRGTKVVSQQPERRRRQDINVAALESSNNDTDCGNMVVYQPTLTKAELLLSLNQKGLKSSRGVSLSRALRKFHREREVLGLKIDKVEDENDVLGTLRLKLNDRGEIVIFMI